MPQIRYRAIDGGGKAVEGRLEGVSVGEALSALHAQGFSVYEAAPDADKGESFWTRDILARTRLNADEAAAFARELATLIDASLPVDEALATISARAARAGAGRFAARLREKVRSGVALSQAMRDARTLAPSYLALVEAGEATGALGPALLQVADLAERDAAIKSEVRSALLYPAILVAMAIATAIFIVTALLPNLTPVFEDAGAPLPAPVRTLIGLGAAIKLLWLPLLLVAALLYLFRRRLAISEERRTKFERALLIAPLIGDILLKIDSAAAARTIGLLLKGRVPMVKAVTLAASVVRNKAIGAALNEMARGIEEGRSFTAALEETAIFPSLMTRLAAAGDRSGRLDAMLIKAAEIMSDEAMRAINRAVGLVTPLLTVLIGLLIGGLVFTVLSAILSVNDLAI